MDQSFWKVVHSRRSIRQFRPDPVPEDVLRRILEAAHAAPSAHHIRPWRFAVLREESARRSLAERMAEAYRRDAEAEGRPAEKIYERNERSIARITGAPLAVLVCLDEACLPADAGRRKDGEHLLLVHSAAAAIENLLLAACAEGLGGCWIGAPVFCPQAVRESLSLPESWVAQALVLLGCPAEEPQRPEGPVLDEVVRWT